MKDNSRNLQVLHNKLKEFREKMLKIKKKKKLLTPMALEKKN